MALSSENAAGGAAVIQIAPEVCDESVMLLSGKTTKPKTRYQFKRYFDLGLRSDVQKKRKRSKRCIKRLAFNGPLISDIRLSRIFASNILDSV